MVASIPSQDTAVLNAIERAASAGLPCPTNDVLAGMIGAGSVATPARCLKRLERRGVISVQRGNCSRVVTVVASGRRTAGIVNAAHWRERGALVREARYRRPYIRREGVEPPGPSVPENYIPVDRDPCFKCGVRADIGCKHHRNTEGRDG